MNYPPPGPISLPLEALFIALDQAQFDTSPATRVRAWRVLEGLGREKFLHHPAALKTYLAPVFVRNAAEQERFYAIFDRFVEEWMTPVPDPAVETVDPPVVEKKPGLTFLQKWSALPVIWKVLAGAIALGLCALIWFMSRPAQKITMPEPDFSAQKNLFTAGDTAFYTNTTDYSKHDSTQYEYSWRLERMDGTVELMGPPSNPWRFVVPAADTGAARQIVLTLLHKPSGKASAKYTDLTIACANRPSIPQLLVPTSVVIGKSQRMGIAGKPLRGLKYRWQIIGDTLLEKPVFNYTFTRNGTREVFLVVQDTTQPGSCTADTTFAIRVGEEKVTLPYKALQADTIEPVAMYSWLTYLLMSLLGIGMIVTWVKWAARKPPAVEPAAPGIRTPVPEHTDRPPYFIPFRAQNGVVRTTREQYRLGDALRRRQEGRHRVLDIPATLRATLDRGGYPAIRYRYLSRPTDYLFLVDEQLPGNHQARLFRHLAENLRGQDVALEMFWYDADFHRFWNRDLPQGTSIEGLQRWFPEHRLVLLGDGHSLIAQTADTTARLQPRILSALKGWSARLLLTPVSPGAWNWREGALFRAFSLFPADVRGLSDAATFIETGLDSEDLPPSFWTWQQQQAEHRRPAEGTATEPAWRTAQDHANYLAPYPTDLLRWFRALTVTPTPVWETTLAIAKALGIPVSHDRLLALARIPALQEGAWHPRLLRELRQTLDKNDERLARTAVRAELEAVRDLAKDSHAARDLESSLAVQQFILDADDSDNQALVLALLNAGLISRRQEEELDFAVSRLDNRSTTVRDWIIEHQPAPPPPPKAPFFTPMFWAATAQSLLFLLLFGFGWRYSGTVDLRRMVFADRQAAFTPGGDDLKDNGFVKEDWVVDSAIVYNNQSYLLSRQQNWKNDAPGIPLAAFATNEMAALFERAQQLRAPAEYPIATTNLFNLWYNRGAETLANSTRPDDLQTAILYFSKAERVAGQQYPRLRLDALHGNGVAVFYAGIKTEAFAIYRQLDTLHYFDTLPLRPNLQTLLLNIPIAPTTTKPPPAIADRDGDGIADAKDKCPDIPAPGTIDGCPDVNAIIAAIARGMVPVQGGTFTMGCTEEQGEDCFDSEKPPHLVTVSDYAIGQTEVTIAQYLIFCDETKTHYPEWLEAGSDYNIATGTDDSYKKAGMDRSNGTHPITGVSWEDGVAYCQWLSQKTGKKYRLPTEAEWEFAARGGNNTKKTKYAGSDAINAVAWYTANTNASGTRRVATKKANELGIYDMSGNVYEWCADWYDAYKNGGKPVLNPTGPEKGSYRVRRGGSWIYVAQLCRVSSRFYYAPGYRSLNIGFRLASPPQ